MPITCTSESLADASDCYLCISPQMAQGIRILLLCNTINGDTMTCTPAALVAAATAAGFDRLSPQQSSAMEILLLCTLANSGGGGGGSLEVFAYSGASPTDPPDNPLAAAITYPEDGASGSVYYWNIIAQAWV